MELNVENKGKVTLFPSDFVASGGEGAVYVKAGTAYKLYGHDDNGTFVFAPKKMLSLGKMQELSVLSHPDIIKPETIVRDKKGVPVGYTMRALPDALCLCQTFPKAFKDRSHLTPDKMLQMVQKLQTGVQHVHQSGLLVVDMNEMNFLVDARTFDHVYFIDVDSYQTPHFPATAIMDSIRDRHNAAFSPLTDWFSFGIVSFQMLVGIHPYKGKHPTLQTIDERMASNVSVFHSDVRLPQTCLPFSVVPQAWRDWYEAVFDKGVRVAPPADLFPVLIVAPIITRAAGSNHFDVEEIGSFDGEILACVGNVVLTTTGVYVGTRRMGDAPSAGSPLAVTPEQRLPVLGRIENGQVVLTDVTRNVDLPLPIAASEIRAAMGRIHVRQNGRLLEVSFTELPSKIIPSVAVIGSLLPQATQLWEGVVTQNLLGAMYVALLPAPGAFHEVRLPELDGCRVVDAKFERGVLIVVGEKNNFYNRWIFRFRENLQTYELFSTTNDVPLVGINFTVLDSGVVVLMNENEEIELFSRTCGKMGVKIIADHAITGDCRLFSRGVQTLFARDGRLFKFTMKKTP